jgi:transcriptional regulator with GAF, ATPase, and Fis domain
VPGKSALAVPVKENKEVIGLLVAVRISDGPFTTANQRLLEAIYDYASVSLIQQRKLRSLDNQLHTR